MSKAIVIKIDTDLAKELSQLSKNLQKKVVKKSLKTIAFRIFKQIKTQTPRDTGALKKAQSRTYKSKKNRATANLIIGSGLLYEGVVNKRTQFTEKGINYGQSAQEILEQIFANLKTAIETGNVK